MEQSENNVVAINGDDDTALIENLLQDYKHCNERRRSAIRGFAHKLAEMEPRLKATILPFPPA